MEPGSPSPLGASVRPDGVNFSVFSKHASRIDLLLFDHEEAASPARVLTLDAKRHRTYHYWHVFVPGLKAGQVYAYRAHGPFAPERGLRFDATKVLFDPYGLAVAMPRAYDRRTAMQPGDNAATAMRSVVADPSVYDWEGDAPLQRRYAETVIYELHVRGFTMHPTSGVSASRRGTFAGLVEKIPYLKDLGVTAVELLPVFQFDQTNAPSGVNYWGYQPLSFFAPHHAYSSKPEPLAVLDEFRDMVKAFHRAGLEVILDVVYNHTSEGGADGPTQCYRGFANDFYYLLQHDRTHYSDFSGTGNTVNANKNIVRRMIRDSLRHWVREMHVDGFRFDLASILARDETGHPHPNPPVVWDIESDPQLAGTKLIAEAWDATGLYQVGSFVGDAWQEWNGRFRDDVRRFVRGDVGTVAGLATRLIGSPDLYEHEDREAEQSINFVTCHDGFTVNDLVSYNEKHNEANGEDNRDGSNDNHSWNCGVEGPTTDEAIEALRNQQVKNLLALTLMSAGTPMLLMGDEVRRTQGGNNNAYCQDNEVSWFDWSLLERHADVHRFVRELIGFRQRRDVSSTNDHLTLNELLHRVPPAWHGVALGKPDWGHDSHSLAFTILGLHGRYVLHCMCNAYWEPLRFALPPVPKTEGLWRRMMDTALPSPDDIRVWGETVVVRSGKYLVQPRSMVLVGRLLKV